MPVSYVVKRSGKRVLFNENKITEAILNAMDEIGKRDEKATEITKSLVVKKLNKDFKNGTPNIEDVQDRVEVALLELGHIDVARAFILYRNERTKLREQKAALIGGKVDEVSMELPGVKLLEQRYLLRDENGEITETPSQLFWRIANTIADAERKHKQDPKQAARMFYRLMSSLEFLPSSPTLMNAGTARQMSPCFVIPIPDDIDGIFKALYHAAVIHKNGGGTGFSFSRIRPRSDSAEGMPGVAAGPLAYMRVFEAGMNAVKQSGRRHGANIAVLRVDHPDILDFINMKLTRNMENFNISVGITDEFLQALKEEREYYLISPRTKKPAGMLSARVVFDTILAVAWRSGDPGLLFLDRINELHPCHHLGEIEATSACGEQPLLPYESSCEGSINLTKCLKKTEEYALDFAKLKKITRQAVQFLDNLIDANNYPVKQVEKATKATRKLGIGLMGFADVLFALKIPYESDEAVAFAEKIMQTIATEAEKTSEELATQRGTFPSWRRSVHERQGRKRRNGTLIAIAPTGTISLIAGVSSGIEPNYALAYSRTVAGGADILHVNPFVEEAIENKELLKQIAKRGIIMEDDELSEELKEVFKTAQQISPEGHIKIQAAFQKYVDGAISKTINYPKNASIKEIESGFLSAWELGCKGVTVYRDGSLDEQVITTGSQ